RRDRFVGQDRWPVLGEPFQSGGTFLNLGPRRPDRLTHLGGHQHGERLRPLPERRGQAPVAAEPLGVGDAPPPCYAADPPPSVRSTSSGVWNGYVAISSALAGLREIAPAAGFMFWSGIIIPVIVKVQTVVGPWPQLRL